MLLKMLSWNVNGLRALAKKPEWQWLLQTDAQIVGLQETKAAPGQIEKEIADWQGWQYWLDSSSVKKGYSGVAIFSELEPLKVTAQVPDARYQGEGRLLHAEYPDFHYFNGYFPNGGAPELNEDGIFTGNFKRLPYKLGFLEKFLEIAAACAKTKPVIVSGDFNIAAQPIDLAHPEENAAMSGFLPIEREWMDKFLAAGFVDSFRYVHGDIPGQYTWWSYQNFARKRNNGWRLDYFFVSKNFAHAIKDAQIYADVKGSDHCPVGITLDIP